MKFHAPQLIWFALCVVAVTINIIYHGEDRTGKYHAGWAIVGYIATAFLLYWGGFFDGGAR